MNAARTFARDPALADVTVRLTDDFPDLPPGSVLRCVARVAHVLLARGVPEHQLSAECERIARAVLERRSTSVTKADR